MSRKGLAHLAHTLRNPILAGGCENGTNPKLIEVDCPLQTVYNQWTQFEEFPRFMEGVKHVRQLDDKRLHWDVEIAGTLKEWNARITEQIPRGSRRDYVRSCIFSSKRSWPHPDRRLL
jgi:uncharacterized membrane protein